MKYKLTGIPSLDSRTFDNADSAVGTAAHHAHLNGQQTSELRKLGKTNAPALDEVRLVPVPERRADFIVLGLIKPAGGS